MSVGDRGRAGDAAASGPGRQDRPLAADWYKDAVIYQLHVKAFFDSNGDGIGDFGGLMQRLDYVESLGVDAIWILPFYPSPLRDDGYDIADYRSINPVLRDDARLPRLRRRGPPPRHPGRHRAGHQPHLRPASLVPAGAHAPKPGSAARDFYVWSDTDERYQGTRIIFIDTEKSNWTWDPEAQAFFWHRFYSHQPDLNFDNPKVLEEVKRLLHYWLDMGVDGLRLDAIPYLVERDGTNNENLPETHDVLKEIRAEMDAHYPDRMLLAEANQWPEDTRPYFGDGDECHMGVPLPADAAHVHGAGPGGPPSDHRHHPPDAGHPGQLPVGDLPAQPRRADARDGDRRGARLPVADLRQGLPRPHQSRHPPPPGAADGQRPAQDRADERAAAVDARHAGHLLRRRDRHGRQLLSSATATACARRCSGRATATAASPAPTRSSSTCRRSWTRSTASRRSTSRRSRTRPISLLNWMRRLIAVRKQHKRLRPRHADLPLSAATARSSPMSASTRASGSCASPTCRGRPRRSSSTCRRTRGAVPIELTGGAAFPPVGDLPYMLTLPAYGFFWFLLADGGRRAALARPGARPAARIRHPDRARRQPEDGRSRAASSASSNATRCRNSCRASAGSPTRARRSSASRSRRSAASPATPNQLALLEPETGERRSAELFHAADACCGARRTSASARRSCPTRWPSSAPAPISARYRRRLRRALPPRPDRGDPRRRPIAIEGGTLRVRPPPRRCAELDLDGRHPQRRRRAEQRLVHRRRPRRS